MTAPIFARSVGGTRRYSHPARPGEAFLSVTSAVGLADKGVGLLKFYAREAATALAGRVADPAWQHLDRNAKNALFRRCLDAPSAVARDAATRGSAVHAAFEAHLLGQGNVAPLDADGQAMLDAAVAVMDTNGFTPVSAELTVARRLDGMGDGLVGFAGTMDILATDDAGDTWLLDLKTSKGNYPSTALQLAAYADGLVNGVVWLDDGTEFAGTELPSPTRAGIVHARPGYGALIDLSDAVFDARTLAAFHHLCGYAEFLNNVAPAAQSAINAPIVADLAAGQDMNNNNNNTTIPEEAA
ncbi:MAG: hypothetical protein GY882_04370 [Actinomycetia bacterium]|nr:hypothetical protein [Actinomycetes bacterium]